MPKLQETTGFLRKCAGFFRTAWRYQHTLWLAKQGLGFRLEGFRDLVLDKFIWF